MKRLIHTLIATALFATPALAHDPKLHKGPKVEGEVISVTGNRLEVGTKGGAVAVTLTPETKFEQGEGGAKAAKSDLKEGRHVMVSGRKLGSGEFAASEVMIRGVGGGEAKPDAHDDDDE